MPRLALAAALMLGTATAALSQTFEAPGTVERVTLYPWGASVTRRVEISAPEGVHEVIVPNLPEGTDPATLRVSADGLGVGAVSLLQDRMPPTDAPDSPAVAEARAAVEAAEAVLRDRDAAIAAHRIRAKAAEERLDYLRGLRGAPGENQPLDTLREIGRLVEEEAQAAMQLAFAAEAAAEEEVRAREPEEEALDRARQALTALSGGDTGRAALSVTVEVGAGGSGSLEITSFTGAARWEPVYDLRLTRGEGAELVMERGALVSQSSGEDWRDVEVTLSTARPAEQSAPTELWPWLRRIVPEVPPEERARTFAADAAPAMLESAAAVEMMGATVTYRYGNAVTLRDGVESLRLSLDDIALDPELTAEAVPARDISAFLVAETVNGSGEILLPGQATLFLDGAMVGSAPIPLTPAGEEMRLGFGPIDGLRLTYEVPERSEGDRGVITRSNEQREVAILRVENLTGESWPLRVIGQVPYSEQNDLTVAWRAEPMPSETDLDGARGILAWDSQIAAGETQEIRLETTLGWPTGMVLE